MRIIDSGTVFMPEAASPEQSSAFPQICVTPTGRWLCGFRAAPLKSATAGQQALLCHCDNQGATWSQPCAPWDPPPVDGRPGVFRAAPITPLGDGRLVAALCWVDQGDPALPFFNETTQGLLDTRIFLSFSADAGASWTPPQLVDTSPFDVPTPLTGPLLILADGSWALQFELNKHYYDETPWRHHSVLLFSRDQGRTWPDHAIVSGDPRNRIFYWDQRPLVRTDGRLLDVFWTYDTQDAVYLNIHACESTDHGRRWSAMWDTHIPGQPAPPVELDDRRLVLVYVDRTAAPAIKARISSDQGRTWTTDSEITLYDSQAAAQIWRKTTMQDAWAEMGAYSVGLPAAARTTEDDVLAVYYAGGHTDHTGIHWVRLRP